MKYKLLNKINNYIFNYKQKKVQYNVIFDEYKNTKINNSNILKLKSFYLLKYNQLLEILVIKLNETCDISCQNIFDINNTENEFVLNENKLFYKCFENGIINEKHFLYFIGNLKTMRNFYSISHPFSKEIEISMYKNNINYIHSFVDQIENKKFTKNTNKNSNNDYIKKYLDVIKGIDANKIEFITSSKDKINTFIKKMQDNYYRNIFISYTIYILNYSEINKIHAYLLKKIGKKIIIDLISELLLSTDNWVCICMISVLYQKYKNLFEKKEIIKIIIDIYIDSIKMCICHGSLDGMTFSILLNLKITNLVVKGINNFKSNDKCKNIYRFILNNSYYSIVDFENVFFENVFFKKYISELYLTKKDIQKNRMTKFNSNNLKKWGILWN